jgi:hypothetical protein
LEIQKKPAHPATTATSPTNALTMTVSAAKAEAAPVCWTGGGLTVWVAVALVPAVGVVVASVAGDDDDSGGEGDSLLGADEDEAEDSGAELDAELELELEPELPGVMPPLFVPGSVLPLVFPAAVA